MILVPCFISDLHSSQLSSFCLTLYAVPQFWDGPVCFALLHTLGLLSFHKTNKNKQQRCFGLSLVSCSVMSTDYLHAAYQLAYFCPIPDSSCSEHFHFILGLHTCSQNKRSISSFFDNIQSSFSCEVYQLPSLP